MPRRLSLLCLLAGWLCASGSMLDVAQVFAWTRMFSAYSAAMPLGRAAEETFDGSKPCPICLAVRRARQREQREAPPATTRTSELMVLACEETAPVIVAPVAEPWPTVTPATARSWIATVPVPPPRAARLSVHV